LDAKVRGFLAEVAQVIIPKIVERFEVGDEQGIDFQ